MKKFLFLSLFLFSFIFQAHAQTGVTPAGKEPVLKIGGLIQFQGDFGDRGDSRFTTGDARFYLRRARLNATGKFLEEFDFRLELDLTGSLSNSISNTNLRAQMTDGYINWNRYVAANIRGGQFKTPYGYEALAQDARIFTIERSLVSDRLSPNRQIGVQVAGDFLDKRVSYATGVFNGNGVNATFNDNGKFLAIQRLSGAPWRGKLMGQDSLWTVGENAYYQEDTNFPNLPPEFGLIGNIFTGKRTGVGVDSQFHAGPFDFWVEYLRVKFEPTDGLPVERFYPDGWYVQGSYYIKPKIQGVLKYETFDPDLEPKFTSTSTVTLGFNYLIKSDDIKLMFNYLNTDATGFTDRQNKVLCRMQVIF